MKNRFIKVVIILLFFITLIFSNLNCNVLGDDPGTINITYPNGGTWYEEDSIAIYWTYTNAGNYVKIELYRIGSATYTTISSNTTNDGSYSWTVPDGLSSANYRIKVTSLMDLDIYDYSDYFYLYSRSITITSPTEGDTWFTGEQYTISWYSENTGTDYVKIECIHGSNVYTIDSYAVDDGLEYWYIPEDFSSGSNYRIKISSYNYNNVYEYSYYFTISRRSITVTSPAKGDTYYEDDDLLIKWDSSNIDNYVYIDLYYDINYYYTNIVSSTENDGIYNWKIPEIASSYNYRIRVASMSYSNVYDFSENFTIFERYININSPIDGEVLYTTEDYKIKWESESAGDKVNIELFKDGVYYFSIKSNVENNGEYNWKISDDLLTSYGYQIRIASISYSDIYGISGFFTVEERSITIYGPSEGVKWQRGGTYFISWDSVNIGDYVNIELYENGTLHSVIANNVYNSYGYNWKIPNDLSPGKNYQIKISSTSYEDVYSFSEGYIEIEENSIGQLSGFLLVILLIVIIIVVSLLFLKIRKKKLSSSKKVVNEIVNSQNDIKETVKPQEMSREEYENIWEKHKF